MVAPPALAGGQRSASVPALLQVSPPLCLRQVCSAKHLEHCGGGSDGHMPLIGAVARSAADGGRSALSSTRHPQGLQNPAHPQGERGLTWPPGAVPGARAAARRDQQLARRRPQWMGILRRLLLRLLDGFQVLRSGGGGGGDTESETGGAQRRHKHDVDNTGSEEIMLTMQPAHNSGCWPAPHRRWRNNDVASQRVWHVMDFPSPLSSVPQRNKLVRGK